MASTEAYRDFVLGQLSGLDEITHRKMMGEYLLYYRGKLFGGIYDDRLLLKPTDAAIAMLPDVRYETPYEGAKPMVVADVDDAERLQVTVQVMYEELPAPKKR